jgi:glycogen debranching enzyme
MALKIKIGPPQLAIHQGHTVLITDSDGQISWPSQKGLFYKDTRLISAWSISADGVPWELLNSGALTFFAERIFLTNAKIPTQDGEIAAHTLGLVIGRQVEGGVREDYILTNYSLKPVRFNLEIAIRSDFADLFEVKSGNFVRRGRIETEWFAAGQCLTTTYRNRDFTRGVSVKVLEASSTAVYANGRLSFPIELPAGASGRASLGYILHDDGETIGGPEQSIEHYARSKLARHLGEWHDKLLRLDAKNADFQAMYEQAITDIAALRMPMPGVGGEVILPAAGLPWFVALFGRDATIISLQTAMIGADLTRGTLTVLGHYQSEVYDDYRDAEPGKIPHELRLGELAHFKLIPHTPYYGTADATPLYLINLHTIWRWTGDKALLTRLLPVAERCLAWIDEYGDLDGDGFQEYQTRSSAGAENQSWKDSGDGVMNPDGSDVEAPKALCELQGYVYDAWLRMAEIFEALGQLGKAALLRGKAAAMFERFNAVFWDEEAGFYALALDAKKRRVMSIASNPGHCLWSGIVPPDRAKRVMERLMRPDMCSGWGIRTLSDQHVSFNPYNYQTGAVWPHDNGIIALGFKRYGFHEQAAQIACEITGAAAYLILHQLPELYAGIHQDDTDFPVQYLGANVPQGWAAGSVFSLLQAMLGLTPDAPSQRLYVDPALPDWLPELTLRNLRVGDAAFDIRFEGNGFEVLRGDSQAVIRCGIAEARAAKGSEVPA